MLANEGLKIKKHVVKKGTIFVVMMEFKQYENGRGDTEVAECQ